jgi:DNA-binding protein HU-beta
MTNKMTKAQLANIVAEQTELSPLKASACINVIFEAILAHTREGGVYTQPNFGKFSQKDTPEHMGHNPATGEDIIISARTGLKFTASKQTIITK